MNEQTTNPQSVDPVIALCGYADGTVLPDGTTIVADYQDSVDENNLDANNEPTVTKVLIGWHKQPAGGSN